VQGAGRIAPPMDADLIALSAHKLYGPKGIGALWIRDGVELAPLIYGGGQEGGLRSGTLSPALCAGFGAAAALAQAQMAQDHAHVAMLWERARTIFAGWTLNGSAESRWRGNLNLRLPGLDVARLMSDLRDVAARPAPVVPGVPATCCGPSVSPMPPRKALSVSASDVIVRLGKSRMPAHALPPPRRRREFSIWSR
jgi:hypothetical protein